jgi:hypothetical protein
LDAFFGVEANINWKKMLEEGQLLELFRSENAIRTVASYNTFENRGRKQQGGTFGLALVNWPQKYTTWVVMILADGHGCCFGVGTDTRFEWWWHTNHAPRRICKSVWYINSTNDSKEQMEAPTLTLVPNLGVIWSLNYVIGEGLMIASSY